MSNRYNGWTNYETWHCALILSSDQGISNYWLEMANEILENNHRDKNPSVHDFREQLKAELEEQMYELISYLQKNASSVGVFGDYLEIHTTNMTSAFSEINFHEIADHYISDALDNMEVSTND